MLPTSLEPLDGVWSVQLCAAGRSRHIAQQSMYFRTAWLVSLRIRYHEYKIIIIFRSEHLPVCNAKSNFYVDAADLLDDLLDVLGSARDCSRRVNHID